MEHIKTFENFLNEGNDLAYWKDYEVDSSPQSDPDMTKKITGASLYATKCIEDAINHWHMDMDGEELSDADEDKINDLAMKFFKKFNYINGNIVFAMISQEQ